MGLDIDQNILFYSKNSKYIFIIVRINTKFKHSETIIQSTPTCVIDYTNKNILEFVLVYKKKCENF